MKQYVGDDFIKVAICDDEAMVVDKIEKNIIEYGYAENVDFIINKFYSGESLIESGVYFDLIFLDIEMKDMNGIATAEKIRQFNMDLPIVYITSYSDYCMQAYKVHAFDFISKPFEYNDIENVLNDLRRLGEKQGSTVVQLKTENSSIMQTADDIVYMVMADKREIYMYLAAQRDGIKIKGNLSDIYKLLDANTFFMPHKSYIVNLQHVKSVENYYDIIMYNGDVVPLSQRKREQFKEQMHKYVLSKGVLLK